MRKKLSRIGLYLGVAVMIVSMSLLVMSVIFIDTEKHGNTAKQILPLNTEFEELFSKNGFKNIRDNDGNLLFKETQISGEDPSVISDPKLFIRIADVLPQEGVIYHTLNVTPRILDSSIAESYWFTTEGHIMEFKNKYVFLPPPEMPDFDVIRFEGVTPEGMVLEYFQYPYYVAPGFHFYMWGIVGGFLLFFLCVMFLDKIRQKERSITRTPNV